MGKKKQARMRRPALVWWWGGLAVLLAMGPLLVAVEGAEVEPLTGTEALAELGQGRRGRSPSTRTKRTFADKVKREMKKEEHAAEKAAKPAAASTKKSNVDPGPTRPSISKASLPSALKKEDDVNAPRKSDSLAVLKAKADRKIKEIAKLEKIKDQLTKKINGKGDKIGKPPEGDNDVRSRVYRPPKKEKQNAVKRTEKRQHEDKAKKAKPTELGDVGERNVEVKVDPKQAEFQSLMRGL